MRRDDEETIREMHKYEIEFKQINDVMVFDSSSHEDEIMYGSCVNRWSSNKKM